MARKFIVEEVEDDSSFIIELIFYLLMFSILLPIGVIWLLWKIVTALCGGTKKQREENISVFENSVNGLYRLKQLQEQNMLTPKEFNKKRKKLASKIKPMKADMDVINTQLQWIGNLNQMGLLYADEYEEKDVS